MNDQREVPSRREFLLRAAVAAGAAGALPAAVIPKRFKFYTQCLEVGVPGVKPRPVAEQVKLLRETGFDGASYSIWLDEKERRDNLRAFDEGGLKVFMFESGGLNISPQAVSFLTPGCGSCPDRRLLSAIRDLKGRDVIISSNFFGRKPAEPEGIEQAVRALRELGDVAAEAGARISIYNHDGHWPQSVPFNIEVVKKVNHPRVGFNFNVCHWVKDEGARDYAPLLRENAAKLFCVNICGSEIGAPWDKVNGLVQPLDGGNFDNRALVALLAEIGYTGPVGLMCIGIRGDPREHLTRSMNVWKSWFAQ